MLNLQYTVEGRPLLPVDCLSKPAETSNAQGPAGTPVNSAVLPAEASHLLHL